MTKKYRLFKACKDFFYYSTVKLPEEMDDLLSFLTLSKGIITSEEARLKGMVFVITGSLTYYENRNALKALIEQEGGKVTGSVTSKTTYLINNDVKSTSSKNKKAAELGVPILSEDDFRKMLAK